MNLDKLDAAIAYIEAHPDEHDQSSWFSRHGCGTTACLAGTVALQCGWVPQWMLDGYIADYVTKGGEREYTPRVAARILDLNADDADALFLGATDLAEIKAVRDALAAGQRDELASQVMLEIFRHEIRWYHWVTPEARNIVTDRVRTDIVKRLAEAGKVDIGTAEPGGYSVPSLIKGA